MMSSLFLIILVNKRRTKFATVTRELPDVNLKGKSTHRLVHTLDRMSVHDHFSHLLGLTANDVRIAQVEFNKFDIDGDGI